MDNQQTETWRQQRDDARGERDAYMRSYAAACTERDRYRQALEDIANGDAERWQWPCDNSSGHCDSMYCYHLGLANDDIMNVARQAIETARKAGVTPQQG